MSRFRPNTMRFEKRYSIGDRGAVYEFNIKLSSRIRGVNCSDEQLEADAEAALEELEHELRQKFRWIGRVYREGRSGGWLAIEDKTGGASEGALEIIEELVDTARERFESELIQAYGFEHEEASASSGVRGHTPNAISPKLRKAYDFFKEHAGYVVGRRGMGALELARAEAYADEHGWEAIWEDDPEEWLLDVERPEEVLTCVLRDENGVVIGSLGGIDMSGNTRQDRDYRRVVEAELALEAMPDKGHTRNGSAPMTPRAEAAIRWSKEHGGKTCVMDRFDDADEAALWDACTDANTHESEDESAIYEGPGWRVQTRGDGDSSGHRRNAGRGLTRNAGRRTRWTDSMILESVRDHHGMTPEATERAHELEHEGLIDMRGTWRLTQKGGKYLRDAALRRNGEPRKFAIGSGPWWTYYETGSLERGDKAIHIHRVPTRALARTNALSLQRVHGGFVTVFHRGQEVDSVGPERASWTPGRAQ